MCAWLLMVPACAATRNDPGGASGRPTDDAGTDAFVPICEDPDSDGDTISDRLEGDGLVDTDGDGTPDHLDDDSDNDGWPDAVEASLPGASRSHPCLDPADADGDGIPDFRDPDSDGDGVPDADERAYDPDGTLGCRVLSDCDRDTVIDLIELAAGSDPSDGQSMPPDATLYFVLPFDEPEKTKDFSFSTGVKMADVYFMIDTTASMQPAIDNVAHSLNESIIPTLLNGDAKVKPAIPAIPGAWVGVGEMRDVPWKPYGAVGDELYRNAFLLDGPGGAVTYGNVAAPASSGSLFTAPETVSRILSSLQAGGGGDAAEGSTQALWIAATGEDYSATLGGYWQAEAGQCDDPFALGAPCFRPGALPIFVVITDAPLHNGPHAELDYDSSFTGGTRSYGEVTAAVSAIGAKVIGVPVSTGLPGAARVDLTRLALDTGSTFLDPAFGASEQPLVSPYDTESGQVSSEVVRLVGLLAGQGLHHVTTTVESYSCSGGIDCDGDGEPDPSYENPIVGDEEQPFDASLLISGVEPVESQLEPLPYKNLDGTTFWGVRGDATVQFKVRARNTILDPLALTVLRARIQVQTPKGQLLGGTDGVKIVHLVVPKRAQVVK